VHKSLITNLIALSLAVAGWHLNHPIVFNVGLFAVSGAVTNWLAVHMLFEKIPGLYGSGVIPARFEDFKLGIRSLMMEQFFTEENIDRFLSTEGGIQPDLHLAPVIHKVDLAPTFDSFVTVISESKFGSMLAMVGGVEALQPLKEPFIKKMKSSLEELTRDEAFIALLREELEQPGVMAEMQTKVSAIIEKRLDELTPELVKEIIQKMIREHLGWLVVWGGFFGGLIGWLFSFTQTL
jgi:uncharacterized membrane protein YheB (UPF0754 family)